MIKNHRFITCCCALMLLSICACTSDDQQDPQPQLTLESVGFSGTLPDGNAFGTENIEIKNGLGAASSSTDVSFIYQSLSILDPDAGIGIAIELPHVKYSDDYMLPDDPIIQKAAQTYYPYPVVKDKLSRGDKLLLSQQHPDVSSTFRLLVLDQKNYTGFTSEGSTNQSGSYLKVVELIEGTKTDPNLGSIKTLDVIFDVDVNL